MCVLTYPFDLDPVDAEEDCSFPVDVSGVHVLVACEIDGACTHMLLVHSCAVRLTVAGLPWEHEVVYQCNAAVQRWLPPAGRDGKREVLRPIRFFFLLRPLHTVVWVPVLYGDSER